MDSQKKLEFKVGIVSLLALVLLIGGIILGKGYRAAMSRQVLHLRFPTSSGLEPGSPVVVNGVKRGAVIDVKNDGGQVLAEASLDNISDIKEDAQARISILEITGGKKIEINPGSSSNQFNPKNEIKGVAAPDLVDLVIAAGEVSQDAKLLVRRLDTITKAASELMADGKFIGRVKNIAQNVDEMAAGFNSFQKNNLTDLSKTLKSARTLVEKINVAVDRDDPKLTQLIDQLNTTVSKAQVSIGKADKSIDKIDEILTDINKISKDFQSSDSFAKELLFDKGFRMKLDSTFNSLSKLVDFINQNGVNVNLRLGTRP